MGVFDLFKSKSFKPEVFEKELTDLTQRISKTQQQINRLSQKNDQLKRHTLSFLVLLYVIFIGYQYQKVPKDVIGKKSKIVLFFHLQTSRNLLIITLFPVTIYFLWVSIDFLFKFIIASRKKLLQGMKEKHKEKIEELKKITNFNKTNELISKYGASEPKNNGPLPQKRQQPTPAGPPASGTTGVQSSLPVPGQEKSLQQQHSQQPLQQPLQQQLPQKTLGSALPFTPARPTLRTFQDRILDYIIGSDNNESIETRYALICRQCYTHCGLAPPGCTNPLTIAYVCPKCGFLNGIKNIKTDSLAIELSPTNSVEPDKPINEDNGEAEPVIPHEIEKHPDIIASSIRRNSHE